MKSLQYWQRLTQKIAEDENVRVTLRITDEEGRIIVCATPNRFALTVTLKKGRLTDG